MVLLPVQVSVRAGTVSAADARAVPAAVLPHLIPGELLPVRVGRVDLRRDGREDRGAVPAAVVHAAGAVLRVPHTDQADTRMAQMGAIS